MFHADYYDRELNPPDDGEMLLDRCKNETCERLYYQEDSDADQPTRFCSRACEIEEREAEA